MKISFCLFVLLFFTFSLNAQIASFSFKTVTENGTFSPKHVLVVWVEKADGTFVKTLKLQGNTRKQYLYTWNAKSNGNTTDAFTGSTINSHTSHVVNWNLRDLSGNLVSDGDYKIVVEYTDKHAQGPLFTLTFTKNSVYSTQSPVDQSYFINMYFLFDPTATNMEKFDDEDNVVHIFPNPGNGIFNLTFEKAILQSGNLEILDATGKLVYKQVINNSEMDHTISVDLSHQTNGLYFLAYKSEGQIVYKKFLILR